MLIFCIKSNWGFSKKICFSTMIKIVGKLNAKKYIATNKSRYIRAKNDMRTVLFARNSTSQWKRVWFLHRRHGRRVLMSGKVRYGFLLDVWWPDLYDCLCAWTLLILSRKVSDSIISYKHHSHPFLFLFLELWPIFYL